MINYHPSYLQNMSDWERWRDTYNGGRDFVSRYLKKFSSREDDTDFQDRIDITYCPSFAAAAINDVRNAIYQRIVDVVRNGGSPTYQRAIEGELGGVDYRQNTMSSFIGLDVLTELLVMGKVGVLVDNFKSEELGLTISDLGDKHPFLSVYTIENIVSWVKDRKTNQYTRLLLKETHNKLDKYGFPLADKQMFRLLELTNDGVLITLYENSPEQYESRHIVEISSIPFISFEISQSLMRDIADYQIALLNIESSDVTFIRNANFPFFYEFYDPVTEQVYAKQAESEDLATEPERKAGSLKGRRYPNTTKDAPGFVNPNPETLEASMKKTEQIKKDIRALLHLNIATLDPRRQSSDSKAMDDRSLEAGLSTIGLELQRGEREITKYWAEFEGTQQATVTYPTTYTLKTDAERRDEAKELDKLCETVPSNTFRKEMKKMIVERLHGRRVSVSRLKKMIAEIEESTVVTGDPNILLSAHKAGLIDDVSAAIGLGVGDGSTIAQARKDRAERIALTIEAQGGQADAARGAPEFDKGTNPEDEKAGKAGRGKQDNTNIGRD